VTKYSVRCRNGSCRHRRMATVHPDEYAVVPVCPVCKQRNGWRLESRHYPNLVLCSCEGPMTTNRGRTGKLHYPHKTTHPLCDKHPEGIYNQMKMRGIADEDIPPEYLPERFKNAETCPF
jgi:hypothetical protein